MKKCNLCKRPGRIELRMDGNVFDTIQLDSGDDTVPVGRVHRRWALPQGERDLRLVVEEGDVAPRRSTHFDFREELGDGSRWTLEVHQRSPGAKIRARLSAGD